MDFEKIFHDLKAQAEKAAKEFELEQKIEQGKDLGEEALERLKTDRNAQIGAVGAGALLSAALLGTRGGRRFLGGAMKTGAVAGLGALAYHAWRTRQGADADSPDADTVEAAGFVTDKRLEPDFAEALVRTMVAAAWSDGSLKDGEREAIETALAESGSDEESRRLLMGGVPEHETLAHISKAARSPNHAAQLYAAACVVTGEPNAAEAGFLGRLSDTLGLEASHAEAIRREVAAEARA